MAEDDFDTVMFTTEGQTALARLARLRKVPKKMLKALKAEDNAATSRLHRF